MSNTENFTYFERDSSQVRIIADNNLKLLPKNFLINIMLLNEFEFLGLGIDQHIIQNLS